MKVGDFSLQLVDATTKEPFKEHVAPSDGQVYAGKTLLILCWVCFTDFIIFYECSHNMAHIVCIIIPYRCYNVRG